MFALEVSKSEACERKQPCSYLKLWNQCSQSVQSQMSVLLLTGGERERMTTNHETYLLMASTQNDMEDWVKTIRRVIWAPFGGGQYTQTCFLTALNFLDFIETACFACLLSHVCFYLSFTCRNCQVFKYLLALYVM